MIAPKMRIAVALLFFFLALVFAAQTDQKWFNREVKAHWGDDVIAKKRPSGFISKLQDNGAAIVRDKAAKLAIVANEARLEKYQNELTSSLNATSVVLSNGKCEAVGFSPRTSTPSPRAPSCTEKARRPNLNEWDVVTKLAEQFAPIYHFNSDEMNFPDSVFNFVDHSNLETGPMGSYYSLKSWVYRRGSMDFSTARLYVDYFIRGDSLNIKYYTFYPYSSKLYTGLNIKGDGMDISLEKLMDLDPFGVHEGDWELTEAHVNLKDKTLSGVTTWEVNPNGQFAKPLFHPTSTFNMTDSHPNFYVASGTHNVYTTPGKHRLFAGFTRCKDANSTLYIGADLYDRAYGNGKTWYTPNFLRHIRDPRKSTPSWVSFNGFFGNMKNYATKANNACSAGKTDLVQKLSTRLSRNAAFVPAEIRDSFTKAYVDWVCGPLATPLFAWLDDPVGVPAPTSEKLQSVFLIEQVKQCESIEVYTADREDAYVVMTQKAKLLDGINNSTIKARDNLTTLREAYATAQANYTHNVVLARSLSSELDAKREAFIAQESSIITGREILNDLKSQDGGSNDDEYFQTYQKELQAEETKSAELKKEVRALKTKFRAAVASVKQSEAVVRKMEEEALSAYQLLIKFKNQSVEATKVFNEAKVKYETALSLEQRAQAKADAAALAQANATADAKKIALLKEQQEAARAAAAARAKAEAETAARYADAARAFQERIAAAEAKAKAAHAQAQREAEARKAAADAKAAQTAELLEKRRQAALAINAKIAKLQKDLAAAKKAYEEAEAAAKAAAGSFQAGAANRELAAKKQALDAVQAALDAALAEKDALDKSLNSARSDKEAADQKAKEEAAAAAAAAKAKLEEEARIAAEKKAEQDRLAKEREEEEKKKKEELSEQEKKIAEKIAQKMREEAERRIQEKLAEKYGHAHAMREKAKEEAALMREKALAKIRERAEALAKKIAAYIKAAIEDLKKKTEALNSAESKFNQTKTDLANAQEAFDKATQLIKDLTSQLEDLKQKLNNAPAADKAAIEADIAKIQAQLESAKKDLEEKQKQLAAAKEAYEKAKKEYEEAKKAYEEAKNKVDKIKEKAEAEKQKNEEELNKEKDKIAEEAKKKEEEAKKKEEEEKKKAEEEKKKAEEELKKKEEEEKKKKEEEEKKKKEEEEKKNPVVPTPPSTNTTTPTLPGTNTTTPTLPGTNTTTPTLPGTNTTTPTLPGTNTTTPTLPGTNTTTPTLPGTNTTTPTLPGTNTTTPTLPGTNTTTPTLPGTNTTTPTLPGTNTTLPTVPTVPGTNVTTPSPPTKPTDDKNNGPSLDDILKAAQEAAEKARKAEEERLAAEKKAAEEAAAAAAAKAQGETPNQPPKPTVRKPRPERAVPRW